MQKPEGGVSMADKEEAGGLGAGAHERREVGAEARRGVGWGWSHQLGAAEGQDLCQNNLSGHCSRADHRRASMEA